MPIDKTYEQYEADAAEAMRGLHEAVESLPSRVLPCGHFDTDRFDWCRGCVRCAVCGGPDEDGNGCEYCPAVEAWVAQGRTCH